MEEKLILLGTGLNQNGWEPITEILNDWNYETEILANHEDVHENSRLGLILGYSEVVPPEILSRPESGFVLFHSSKLPRGRGWAPIYNTIIRGLPLVQSMAYAEKNVDAGPVIARAKYPLEGNEVEQEVRRFDDRLTLHLIKHCLQDVLTENIEGESQDKDSATYWERRTPDDSEVQLHDKLSDMVDHLRGLPPEAPAFYEYNGRKFQLHLQPLEPETIEFDSSKISLERCYDSSK